MYLPAAFAETRVDVLQALIASHPLGTWVALDGEELVANNVPFVLDPGRGPAGTLCCHVARPNPVVGTREPALPSVVSFQGPQSYVTPGWYPGKQADGRVVPTWNYVVVHAHGRAVFVDDREWLLRHVRLFTDRQEARSAAPWRVDDAPRDYIDRMIAGVVGVEIRIDRLVGKWKVSQNRTHGERHGVVQGLLERGDDEARAMAALVERHAPSGP